MTVKIMQPSLCPMCGAVVEAHTGRGRPGVYCSSRCRRRAWRARHFTVTVDVAEVVDRWGDDCYLCGEVVNVDEPAGPKALTVDYAVPLSDGGDVAVGNLRVFHRGCRPGDVCPHCGRSG